MKSIVATFIVAAVCVLSSCTNEKAKEVLWDSGPVENIVHGGTYVGKVSVYTIDWGIYKDKV